MDLRPEQKTAPSHMDNLQPSTLGSTPPAAGETPRSSLRSGLGKFWLILALATYIAGVGSGYLFWGRSSRSDPAHAESANSSQIQALAAQINPKDGYRLPIKYGKIGPQMLAAGVIDLEQFVKLYQEIGRPLSQEQMDILTKGSDRPVVINTENQHFLLNLFWAFGLANQNRILTEGPMMQRGKEQVVNFASTGGWTIAAKPVSEIYAASAMVHLSEDQQKRLEEAAGGVYRPCCNNPTLFPDCNHGMAMLGLLELMASQGATTDEMFEAAKYVNAYWFPQQTLEIAMVFKTAKNLDFQQVDSRELVGQNISSGSGYQAVQQWLAQNGKLEQAPQGGGSCGVK